jgi:hypothetical protein
LIGYEAKVLIFPVGKNPTGKIILIFLENNMVYGKFTCGLLIESYFIVRVHARRDNILNESFKGGK